MTVVWHDGDDIEESLSLALIETRHKFIGSQASCDLVFIAGLSRLPAGYKQWLIALNYRLIDASQLYRELTFRFRALLRFGLYEQRCFLRWLILSRLYRHTHICHCDADVVFATRPEDVSATLGDDCFVLQGCPAYAHITDSSWFVDYEENLRRFHNDVDGFSSSAWHMRDSLLQLNLCVATPLWQRRTISSDQDLLRFLIAAGRLRNKDKSKDPTLPFVCFENVLTIPSLPHITLPAKCERVGQQDLLNGKPVAFWHLQSDFVENLANAVYTMIGSGDRNPNQVRSIQRRRPQRSSPPLVLSTTDDRIPKRRFVVKTFFGSANAVGLELVLNRDVYWSAGVFS